MKDAQLQDIEIVHCVSCHRDITLEPAVETSQRLRCAPCARLATLALADAVLLLLQVEGQYVAATPGQYVAATLPREAWVPRSKAAMHLTRPANAYELSAANDRLLQALEPRKK